MSKQLSRRAINIYDEEDFLKEYIKSYNVNIENRIINYEKKEPQEPDFLLTFDDGSGVYMEVTQVYIYSDDTVNHNHTLIDFCAAVQEKVGDLLPYKHGKLVVSISAKINELPTKRKVKEWQELLDACVQTILENATNPQSYFTPDNMPADLANLDLISIHYMANNLRSIIIAPNTFQAYWEEERVGSLYFRIGDKNSKTYNLKATDKVWLLIRDREGFKTIANNLTAKGRTVVSNKFERIFLQEEYDPTTQAYPFLELKLVSGN